MNIETNKRRRVISLLAVVFISLVCIIIALQRADPIKIIHNEDIAKTVNELPSLLDIQKRLNKLAPNNPIPEDGEWGALTRDKWERVYCNEQAKKYFEENAYEKID